MMRRNYARALYDDPSATLDDLREALEIFEETLRTTRRVLGSSHPEVLNIVPDLRNVRAMLTALETPPSDAA